MPAGTGITPRTVTASTTRLAFERRRDPLNALAADADAIAAACHAMAARFHRGGRLVVFGAGPDAAHVVVEFVHPVIVGKPALPAFSLAGPALAEQLELSAGPDDIALAITAGGDDHPGPGGDQRLTEAMDTAGRLGMLRVALLGAACGWRLEPGRVEHLITVRSADPLVVREVQVSCYHLLWELVHVFLERPGALS